MVNLEVRNLGFSYGSNAVLQDVNFAVGTGEFIALLGANGAGKSTLFRCILGLERNFSGEVLIGGEAVRDKNPADLARRIAYIPQIHYPSFNYSALDMVLMGTASQSRAWTVPGADQLRTAETALEQSGAAHLRDRDFRQISGGEQQLVLIARALAQKASLLIMDEPTANLDYGNQLRVLFQIKSLNKQGYSILLSTHNPDHGFLFADRALALHKSRIIAEGAPAEVITPELIAELYGVTVAVHRNGEDSPHCVPLWRAP
ncbi:MAG: ABC transporter ATP-binding protein [Spirochaetaceae bacterium]|nr:ABC transporter ATP-binding protein [Spirochaetaceae bacterium]